MNEDRRQAVARVLLVAASTAYAVITLGFLALMAVLSGFPGE